MGGGAGCPQVPLIKGNLNSPPCSYLLTGACLSSAAGWCNEFHSRTGCPAGRSLQSHNEHSGASIHAPRAAFPQIRRWHMLSTKTPLWRLHLPHQPFGANPIPSDIGCQIQPRMVRRMAQRPDSHGINQSTSERQKIEGMRGMLGWYAGRRENA